MRDTTVSASELDAARDFLIGVFPLRFETASAVVGALTGLVVHGLPVDELIGYRSRIEAVGIDAVAAAARDHVDVDGAAIVLVGDVDAFGAALEAEGLGTMVIEPDDVTGAAGPAPAAAADGVEAGAGSDAVDAGSETGPTAGAEEPSLPGTSDEPVTADTTSAEVD